MPDYRLRLRHPRSLAIVQELTEFAAVSWTRHYVEGGHFSLTLGRGALTAQVGTPPHDHLVLEVERDEAFEFAGMVRRSRYNAVKGTWELTGPDLLSYFLSRRVVNPRELDAVAFSGMPAETALKELIADQLLDPQDAGRDVRGELTPPCTFALGTDAGRGGMVEYNARWIGLLDACSDLSYAGELGQHVTIAGQHYSYGVRDIVDATRATGGRPVVFSVEKQQNLAEAVYDADCTREANAVYALGEGEGALRAVELVTDDEELEDDFRAEAAIDARNADTAEKLQQAGLLHIAEGHAAARSVTVQPLLASPTQYRRDWDIGYDVTVDFPEIGGTVDTRIAAVEVSLSRTQDEQVRVVLGRREATLAAILAELAGRSKQAQLV